MTTHDAKREHNGLAHTGDPLLTALLLAPPLLPEIKWHLCRYDELRYSVANRAAMVLNAVALLLAGSTFLLDKTLNSFIRFSVITRYILFGSIILILAGLALSVFYAIRAVVSMRSTRMLFDRDIPLRLFFNSRDTVRTFKNYSDFRAEYIRISPAMTIEHAMSELFSGIYQYKHRYRNLRIAICSLFATIILFLAAILTYILGIVLS